MRFLHTKANNKKKNKKKKKRFTDYLEVEGSGLILSNFTTRNVFVVVVVVVVVVVCWFTVPATCSCISGTDLL